MWCNLSHAEWQEQGHTLGTPWSILKLNEHRDSLSPTETRAGTLRGVRQQKEDVIFDAVDVDHCMPPWLHLELGIVNDLLQELQSELQAAAEVWTSEYLEVEQHLVWLQRDISSLRTD